MIASRSLRMLLDLGLGPHDDRAAARRVGRADAGAAEDHAAGREIRTGDDLDQLFDRDVRIVDHGDAAVDHLAEVVRRDVGRHADRDAAGAVDEQVREARRQDLRLVLRLVVVRLEVDRVLVDVVQKRHRRAGEARLGVAHRRGRIAVDGAEIALPVDEHAGAWRSPAPCAPGRRRSIGRRAGGIDPSRRRRCGPTSRISGRACSRSRAWRRGCADARASGRRARRAERGSRSRSSRNRDRSASSRRRWKSA